MLWLLPRCGGMEVAERGTEQAPGASPLAMERAPGLAAEAVVAEEEAAAGACESVTWTVERVVPAFQDGYVRPDQPDTAFGSEATLLVDSVPTRYETYLRFRIDDVGGTIERARLRLHVTNATVDGPAVHATTGSFAEEFLTWSSRPGVRSPALADLGALASNSWVEVDVRDAVTADRDFAVALLPTHEDGVDFDSRDAVNPRVRPLLYVTLRYTGCASRSQDGGGALARARQLGGEGGEGVGMLVHAPDGSGFAVAGGFSQSGDFGGAPFTGPRGIVVARYDPSGAHQWSRAYVLDETVFVHGMTVTPVGNILLVGMYRGSPDFGTGALPAVDSPNGAWGAFIVKLSPTGNPVWARGFRTEIRRPPDEPTFFGPASAEAVTTDANGSLIVAGSFRGYMDLGGGELYAGAGSQSGEDPTTGFFLAKFTYDGALVWSKAFPGYENAEPAALATDSAGNILMGGKGARSELGATTLHAPFISKFAPDGTLLWSRAFNGATGTIRGLTALPGNGVGFAGDFNRSFIFAGQTHTSTDPVSWDNVDDVMFGTLSASGGDGWVRTVGGTGWEYANQVGADAAGNLVVGGQLNMDRFDLGGGVLGAEGLFTSTVSFVASYAPDGTHRWSHVLDSAVSSSALGVTPGGTVWLGLTFGGTTRLPGQSFTSHGISSDVLLLELSP